MFRESKEEFRFQAREGFTVVEQGNQVRIERTAQEPLVLTMPKIRELDPMKRVRYALDAVGRLAVLLPRLERLLSRQPGAGRGARRAAPPRRCRKRRAGRAGPGAALPGQPALPVQHAELAVVAGDDRPHRPRREHAARAFDLLPHQPVARSRARTSRLAEEIDLQRLYLDIEKARFPDRLHVEIDVPHELEQARLPALLLQPIVENAIKYGVSKSRKAVVIRIEARHLDDHRMVLEISNRLKHGGKDELPAATHEGTGLGLANVCQRLEARFGAPRELPLRTDDRRRVQGLADHAGGDQWLRPTRCAS